MSRDISTQRVRRWYKNNPWARFLKLAKRRCTDRNHESFPWYGGKGIRCLLTHADLRTLWDRDGAAKMQRPSLDRIDSNRHYEFSNCRFMEFIENVTGVSTDRDVRQQWFGKMMWGGRE